MSEIRLSQKEVKKDFNKIGIVFIVYSIVLLFIPHALYLFMNHSESILLENDFLFFGIYYIIILIATIPFLFLMKNNKLSIKQIASRIDVSFSQLLIQAIIVFTLVTLSIYLTTVINTFLGTPNRLLSNIGNILSDEYLHNSLYVFIFIIVCPIIEEFIYRGVILFSLSKYSPKLALYASTLLYALAHTYFIDMLPSIIIGFILANAVLRYKTIQGSILIHIVFNAFIYILCVVPASIATYMSYGLMIIYFLAIYFVISGKYHYVLIPKNDNYQIARKLFFTTPSIIITIILFILHSIIFITIR